MGVENVLQELRRNRDFMEGVEVWQKLPARPARTVPFSADLPAFLQEALRQQGIDQLYTHQALALEAARRGEQLVIATATASGKSLCYNLPILEALGRDPQATALYLFPTKALAQDQWAALQTLITATGRTLPAFVYDGDTPTHQRSKIRKIGRILLSNPDMLHASLLPNHPSWHHFFANLRYIVIDELHIYRGIFGSHVAHVLRRLQRLCRFYQTSPQFITCSATIANPQEHAQRLCGHSFTLIDEKENGAPQGSRQLILYNPPLLDKTLNLRQSVLLAAVDGGVLFLQERVATAIFVRSRQAVELVLSYWREALAREELPDPPQLAGYRGGYLPLERREIEQGLREGRVEGVVATNALELGVDIGSLGAVIMAGYAGTVSAVWQQAGRAGRRQGEAGVLLIMGNTPLEQYIAKHPRYLFGRSPEHARLNLTNLPILCQHLACAAFEMPLSADETTWSEIEDWQGLLEALHGLDELHATGQRYHWIGEGQPATAVSLRTSSADSVVIQHHAHTIGLVDLARAPVTVHPDAIYLHDGRSFLVERLDWEGRVAHVRPIEVDYYTYAASSSQLRALQPIHQEEQGGILRGYGDVTVETTATHYRQIRRYTFETLGMGKIDLPSQLLETTGYWLILGRALTETLFDRHILARPNDYGGLWESQRQRALERDQFRCQRCGSAEKGLHVHHIIPFREFGYVRGRNRHDVEANQLDNLITLCPRCHQAVEQSVQTRSAMAGLAYALGNIAPLFLMCDSHDIAISAQTINPLTQAPTLVIYEQLAGGLGFAEQLFALHQTLLAAVEELITDCPCDAGCPACVGPEGEIGRDTKRLTLLFVQALRHPIS